GRELDEGGERGGIWGWGSLIKKRMIAVGIDALAARVPLIAFVAGRASALSTSMHLTAFVATGRILSALQNSFYFFQAEDGIRDSSVTGVQTCALPILYIGQLARQLLDLGQLVCRRLR